MATTSLPQSAAILSGVEEFFAELPAKRRRARVEVCDEPEAENYGPAAEPPIVIELDGAALTALPVLLGQLAQARNGVLARLIESKIYALLGLTLEASK